MAEQIRAPVRLQILTVQNATLRGIDLEKAPCAYYDERFQPMCGRALRCPRA